MLAPEALLPRFLFLVLLLRPLRFLGVIRRSSTASWLPCRKSRSVER